MRRLVFTNSDFVNARTEDVIVMGRWCLVGFTAKNRNAVNLLPYHWDNRAKLQADYELISKKYYELLEQLSVTFNDIHKVSHGNRYWEILVGPWLRYFIEIVWDLNETVSVLEATHDPNEIRANISKNQKGNWIPLDFRHFLFAHYYEPWNNELISRILELRLPVICEEAQFESTRIDQDIIENISPKSSDKWKNVFHKVSNALSRQFVTIAIDDFVLSLKDTNYLNMKLGQLPRGRVILQDSKSKTPDWSARETIRNSLEIESVFDEVFSNLIADNIPFSYVESYKDITNEGFKKYPKSPKMIVTGYGYNSNDVYKSWLGSQTEKGAKLVIAQHGGQFGTRAFDQIEDHQLSIADTFISWGWSDKKHPKIMPLPSPKLSNNQQTIKPLENGGLLVVLHPMTRFTTRLSSEPIGPQFHGYLEDQVNMLLSLKKEIRGLTKVRPYPRDYGWGYRELFQAKGLESMLSKNEKTFSDGLNRSRLFVSTYNATTMIETMSIGFPTVLFWNPSHWEIRNSARPYFDKLHEAGILHYSADSAAKHISTIFDDVSTWWSSEVVVEAREQFCAEIWKYFY